MTAETVKPSCSFYRLPKALVLPSFIRPERVLPSYVDPPERATLYHRDRAVTARSTRALHFTAATSSSIQQRLGRGWAPLCPLRGGVRPNFADLGKRGIE
jgi:hypothetical protein